MKSSKRGRFDVSFNDFMRKHLMHKRLLSIYNMKAVLLDRMPCMCCSQSIFWKEMVWFSLVMQTLGCSCFWRFWTFLEVLNLTSLIYGIPVVRRLNFVKLEISKCLWLYFLCCWYYYFRNLEQINMRRFSQHYICHQYCCFYQSHVL